MAKNKKPADELKFPSVWRRVRPTVIYNVIISAIVLPLFPLFYTIDDLAYELDYFMMYGLIAPRWQLVTCVLSGYLFVRQFFKDVNLLLFIIASKKHDEDVIAFGGHKRVFDGIEGVGKTLNATNDAVILACDKDEKMRFEYYLNYPFADDLKDDVHYKVLCDSYKFYKAHPDLVPHLMANYKIEYDGKVSYPFDMRYLDQEKRLAEGFTMSLTELADLLPNSWSKMPKDESKDDHKVIKKNETLSKSRQWFDLTIVSDEQRMGEVFIGFRSTSGLGRSLTGRKTCLKPVFLGFVERLLHNRIMRKKEKTSRLLSRVYTLVHNVTNVIGFYKFEYVDRDVITSKNKSDTFKFVVPRNFLFKYDTRGEREKYSLYSAKPE